MSEPLHPALKAVSDAVLAVAAQRSVEEVLQELVHRARELAGARYAALGIPDGAMGPLPRTHGLLGAMLESAEPHRTEDLHTHPRFRGWWPRGHPDMRSFLGVPIVSPDGVIGSFYLSDKEGGPAFSAEDQELIELLAAHAAIAITNARLYERSRELSIVSERNRLALDLHDAVSQKLFGLVLTAEAAATLLDRDPGAAREQLERIGTLAHQALDELRSLILELRPPDLARDGLCVALRKHVDVLRGLHGVPIELEVDDGVSAGARRDPEVLRIAQEALQNALRHAGATHVGVRLGARDGMLALEVSDDGSGFEPDDPELRSRRLGLTSMEERAQRLGGRLEIRSAPGTGTVVRLDVGRA
jgi:signal transduction histidine kinase